MGGKYAKSCRYYRRSWRYRSGLCKKFSQEDTVIVLDVNEEAIRQCKEKYHVYAGKWI